MRVIDSIGSGRARVNFGSVYWAYLSLMFARRFGGPSGRVVIDFSVVVVAVLATDRSEVRLV